MKKASLFFNFCFFLTLGATTLLASEKDRVFLLEGVEEIGAPGIPGPLVLFREQAFPVVLGKSEGGFESVIAGAFYEKGRVLAFGHPGYWGQEALEHLETQQFLWNSLAWLGSGGGQEGGGQIAVYEDADFLEFLKQKQYPAVSFDFKKLATYRVVLLRSWDFPRSWIPSLQDFVRKGGGLAGAALGWGWLQLNPDQNLVEHFQGNLLFSRFGILWVDGYFEKTSSLGFSTKMPLDARGVHALVLAQMLLKESQGKKKGEGISQAQISLILTQALQVLPFSDTVLLPLLRNLWKTQQKFPSEEQALVQDDLVERLALTYQIRETQELPALSLSAHPCAQQFPGSVPASAERVRATVEIDTKQTGWKSTGCYAAPGEAVEVTLPLQIKGTFRLRIGAHTDALWSLSEWKRAPVISRSFALKPGKTTVANAFGGLIYLEVPEDSSSQRFSLSLNGVVLAPYYVLGKTSLKEWRTQLRKAPAPWGEVASEKIIVTVPSEVLRTLENPESLMQHWDKIADACATLAQRPLERPYPERYVCDVQISVGYMHSGYPIMTHLDQKQILVDERALQEGQWGLFHELGHNHQEEDWTFEGTGEVTVNLFTLYIFETLASQTALPHPALQEGVRRHKMKSYLQNPDFSEWQEDPFLALLFYLQLKEAFTWATYQKVFAEYRRLPSTERPQDDGEKRDQWLIRFSQCVEKNLGPFFQKWGIPVSSEALEKIQAFPVWFPKDFPQAEKK
jgi:hypothetical protein